MREVEPFFKKHDEKMIAVVQYLNNEILEFSKLYEIIV